MQDFYTPKQLAEMFGGGESTWRLRAARGEFSHAIKLPGNAWGIPLSDVNKWGRGYDEECADSQRLDPNYPEDPSDIVLAKNGDGRYGIYIEDDWYGAEQALTILDYLEKHRVWLEQKAKENELNHERENHE